MKKFSLEIQSPCHENLDKMEKNATGFYCSSCTKNVIDLSSKTNAEIAQFISETKDKNNICARLKPTQLDQEFTLIEYEKRNHLKYAAAIAATVLLTSNMVGQETTLNTVQTELVKPRLVGKISYSQPVNKSITFTIKGKLLNITTSLPFSQKKYPNLMVYANGASSAAKVDSKTGKFSITVTLDNSTKEINVEINGHEMGQSKTIPVNLKAVKNNELKQNIMINPEEFRSYKIAGGLGVIMINDKKLKTIS